MGKRGPQPGGTMHVLPARKEGPRPPEGMTPRARARWREIVKAYPPDRFKAGDLPLLRAYCEAHDLACRAEDALREAGCDYMETKWGGFKAHPAVAVKTAAVCQMTQLATKLRLCANSRIDKSKAASEQGEKPSKFAGLTGGRKQ